MTDIIARFSDWILARLVPTATAAAACPESGYTFLRSCGCRDSTEFRQKCTVYPDCSVRCGSCYPYDYCM
jgi:hypothetical protein